MSDEFYDKVSSLVNLFVLSNLVSSHHFSLKFMFSLQANKMTTDVAIESANRYSNDIQAITANAASAAASSAVQAAMQIHREQLEQLRNEALNKGETSSLF